MCMCRETAPNDIVGPFYRQARRAENTHQLHQNTTASAQIAETSFHRHRGNWKRVNTTCARICINTNTTRSRFSAINSHRVMKSGACVCRSHVFRTSPLTHNGGTDVSTKRVGRTKAHTSGSNQTRAICDSTCDPNICFSLLFDVTQKAGLLTIETTMLTKTKNRSEHVYIIPAHVSQAHAYREVEGITCNV